MNVASISRLRIIGILSVDNFAFENYGQILKGILFLLTYERVIIRWVY